MKPIKPETLEGRWDILYRDFPEVYEEWGKIPKTPDIYVLLEERFSLAHKKIADIGSGSGASTIELAKYADSVVGVEIEEAMNAIATEKVKAMGIANVQYRLGDAENIPLAENSVDLAIAVTLAGGEIRKVAGEMERIIKPGGLSMRIDVAPGWYGGELNPVITGAPRDESARAGSRDEILPGLGYAVMDVFLDQEYGSVENVVETYGFIHGKSVIDYVRANAITSIRWKVRIHYKYKPMN